MLSIVIGSSVPTPLLPDACWKIVLPSLFTTHVTKPGIWLLVSAVAASISGE
jgi:hypothetical protein